MIDPIKLLNSFKKNGVTQYVGVPDSVLKHFLTVIPEKKNFISTNEGSAVAYGIGHYLSTKKIPLIYMQNSGLGNAINPLISIAHKKVYSIPLLLLIGWRGSPNSNDEPQHQAQGNVTKNFLKLLGVKFIIINQDSDLSKIKDLINYSKKNKKPVAILIKNNKFSKVLKTKKIRKKKSNIKRILFLENLLQNIGKKDKIISTTGYTSRELYQIRLNKKLNRGKDFYMVGGMGHASNVALGISKNLKNKVIVLDGDGSLLMHLGSLVNCGAISGKNFKYILLNNNSHESVGSQKTLIDEIDLELFSKALGFNNYLNLEKKENIKKKIRFFLKTNKKIFLNVNILEGSIPGLLRPKKFIKIKEKFMKND